MSDTVNLSSLAPGYKYSTQALSDSVSAFSVVFSQFSYAKLGESGIGGKIWKSIKALWASRKHLLASAKSFKYIPRELLDMNGDELDGVARYMWNTYGVRLSPEGQVVFEESFAVLIQIARSVRRIQNTLKPPRAEVMSE